MRRVLGTFPYSAYYRPQTKFAKVMFLHVSVSHSVHGGSGGVPARVGVAALGGGVCSRGVVPALGGCLHQGCLLRGEACSWGSGPRGVCGEPQ